MMSSARCDLRLPHFGGPFSQGGFDGDGEGGGGEHADDAEETKSHIHADERDDGMKSQTASHDLWLHDLPYDRDDRPKDQKSEACLKVPREKLHDRPRDKHRAHTKHGKNIHHRDDERQQEGIFHRKDSEAREQLAKSEEHEKQIGAQVFCHKAAGAFSEFGELL